MFIGNFYLEQFLPKWDYKVTFYIYLRNRYFYLPVCKYIKL